MPQAEAQSRFWARFCGLVPRPYSYPVDTRFPVSHRLEAAVWRVPSLSG